jgi:DnaJ-class molecular chaperone
MTDAPTSQSTASWIFSARYIGTCQKCFGYGWVTDGISAEQCRYCGGKGLIEIELGTL